jgi:DNA-binding transcriptional LysR family regulator
VRQLEEWLAVPLFERRHRDVELTPAGAWFLKEGRSVIKKMQITREQCQQIANGWRGHLSIAVDNIVKPERMRQMIVDFYRHFSTSSCGFRRKCLTASGMRWPTAGQRWRSAQRRPFPSGDATHFAIWEC